MAQNDLLKRFLEAGVQFTQMTQQRAEEIVRDLVKAGEVQAEQAQGVVSELVDRSRKNTEQLVDRVRGEVRNQIAMLDLVTKDVVARLEQQLDAHPLPAARPGPPPGGQEGAGEEGPGRQEGTGQEGTGQEGSSQAAPAKKATAAAKAPAKQAPAKKAPAKKAPAKKATT